LDFKFETGTLKTSIDVPVDGLGGGTLGTFEPDNGGAPLDLDIDLGFLNLLLWFLK
jgi:hypothetical protein